jgi:hypothetical protein
MLELQHDERTISGSIAVDDNPPRSFYGWLELLDRLERATNSELPDKQGANRWGEDISV